MLWNIFKPQKDVKKTPATSALTSLFRPSASPCLLPVLGPCCCLSTHDINIASNKPHTPSSLSLTSRSSYCLQSWWAGVESGPERSQLAPCFPWLEPGFYLRFLPGDSGAAELAAACHSVQAKRGPKIGHRMCNWEEVFLEACHPGRACMCSEVGVREVGT